MPSAFLHSSIPPCVWPPQLPCIGSSAMANLTYQAPELVELFGTQTDPQKGVKYERHSSGEPRVYCPLGHDLFLSRIPWQPGCFKCTGHRWPQSVIQQYYEHVLSTELPWEKRVLHPYGHAQYAAASVIQEKNELREKINQMAQAQESRPQKPPEELADFELGDIILDMDPQDLSAFFRHTCCKHTQHAEVRASQAYWANVVHVLDPHYDAERLTEMAEDADKLEEMSQKGHLKHAHRELRKFEELFEEASDIQEDVLKSLERQVEELSENNKALRQAKEDISKAQKTVSRWLSMNVPAPEPEQPAEKEDEDFGSVVQTMKSLGISKQDLVQALQNIAAQKRDSESSLSRLSS